MAGGGHRGGPGHLICSYFTPILLVSSGREALVPRVDVGRGAGALALDSTLALSLILTLSLFLVFSLIFLLGILACFG